MTRVGFTLQPEDEFLEILGDVLREEPDYYEVAPETLWWVDAGGDFHTNSFHRRFEALRAETGKPFVAHGVDYSVGTATTADDERRARWRSEIARTHAAFDFQWYTDHLGVTELDGRALTLPLPLPMTDTMADLVQERLRELQGLVPHVGVENSVFYYLLGDPLDEPAFLSRILAAPGMHLLLDLHNVHTMSQNLDFDPDEYLRRLPLERVIEIHLSGGSWSEPGWLPDGAVLRLDSHDDGVPDEVWSLFERTLRRCPNVRGVTLERMEGSVTEQDAPLLRDELRRIRKTVATT